MLPQQHETLPDPQLLRYRVIRPDDADDLALLTARVVEALGSIGVIPGQSFDIVPSNYEGAR